IRLEPARGIEIAHLVARGRGVAVLPLVADLVRQLAIVEVLGRPKRILLAEIVLEALVPDAGPGLEVVAAADERGVDDEAAAGLDPLFEPALPSGVDVPTPCRQHDDGGRARVAERLAPLAGRLERRNE